MTVIKNNEVDLDKIFISMDETHHLYGGAPLYNKRFKSVMSFHSPGVAAVMDELGSYHIDLNGKPLYNKKFLKTFGYYENIAAVMDDSGWYHINLEGESLYRERFEWVGNFQEERCVVRDKYGSYFHIKINGNSAYNEKHKYVGDFKYGIAVVYNSDGYARHIDRDGRFIHNKNFLELGVFHKGFATASDNRGAFHVNKKGEPLYKKRFRWIEPFYNGCAFVCKHNGEKLIINDKGNIIHEIYNQGSLIIQTGLRKQLMGMLVSYWETQIIRSIVELRILDLIKNGNNTFAKLLNPSQIPVSSLTMIIQVLKIWEFIDEKNGIYELKHLGNLLTEDHPETLKYAALMWGSEHYQTMERLTEALKHYQPQFEQIFGQPIFHYFNTNKERGLIFDKAMKAYTSDYNEVINQYDFSNSKIVMDVGGGTGHLLEKILLLNINIKNGILFEMPTVINNIEKSIFNKSVREKIELVLGNFFEKVPASADTIIMSRVLHDWNDENAVKILKNLNDALSENGRLLILKMIVPENPKYDIGVTLNFNLLVNVGGKERTFQEFNNLLQNSGFIIKSTIKNKGIISLIIAEKINKIM
ncbi:MAG: methyltransferase [Candidatus Thorarchaeota archaeon]